jgi:hypothetical protein
MISPSMQIFKDRTPNPLSIWEKHYRKNDIIHRGQNW